MGSLTLMKDSLRHEAIKWVENENIHLTLKFFGETDENKIPLICSVMASVASETPAFMISLSGLGIFGSRYAPRVIWSGIEPYDHLSGLMNRLCSDLELAGFPGDRQNAVPHLTLGRIKHLKDTVLFRRVIDQHKSIRSEAETVGEMLLYESILRREGPLYRIVERFPLV